MQKRHLIFTNQYLGGKFSKIIHLKDFESPDFHVQKKDVNLILHITLPIGKNKLIGNDVPESMGRVNEQENRSKISINVESREEADKLFSGLSAGGSVEMPIGDSHWGTYFAMFRDKYGIEWIIEFDPSG
jgi:PhnB protein